MSGRILIIDTVATSRIVLKVRLEAAQYQVFPVATLAEGLTTAATISPDLVLMDMTALADGVAGFVAGLRQLPDLARVPVLGYGRFDRAADRIAMLQAGADGLLTKPLSDNLLLAQIRCLLRQRDAEIEMDLRQDTSRALGFADPPAQFSGPAQVTVLSRNVAATIPCARALQAASGHRVQVIDPETVLSAPRDTPRDTPNAAQHNGPPTDVLILDARQPETAIQLHRLIADLRSRPETRQMMLLVLTGPDNPDAAALALDLGAQDVVSGTAPIEEIALRVGRLLRQKLTMDRLRDTVQTGLRAAITDPLTGLYNRRYALPHLANLADKARATGLPWAVMVLDIDHFKQVNDTHGHAVGDKVLMAVADRLRGNLRMVDFIARIGGEEFLIAMPDTSPAEAQMAAERLCALFDHSPVTEVAGGPVRVTLSIGVAMARDRVLMPHDVDAMIALADQALYTAKAAGRNTVTMARTAA